MDKGKQLICILLLTVFSGYYGCLTFYQHIHDVGGCKTVHAHPFSEKESNAHTHTEREFQAIILLSLFQLENSDIQPLFTAFAQPYRQFHEQTRVVPETLAFSYFLLRGPPVV